MISKDYKLKLFSKRLKSGKCQIKFEVSLPNQYGWYGYMLAESGSTLRDVVCTIEKEMRYRERKDTYYHSHLYDLTNRQRRKESILIFNN